MISLCLYTARDTTGYELCIDGDVRLVDGSNPLEGRVEICLNHAWGTICNNQFSTTDATVVCNQLGYDFNGTQVVPISDFTEGTGPIFLDGLACRGDEKRVEDCGGPAPGLHTCTHDQDTAIRCIGKKMARKMCVLETCTSLQITMNVLLTMVDVIRYV